MEFLQDNLIPVRVTLVLIDEYAMIKLLLHLTSLPFQMINGSEEL